MANQVIPRLNGDEYQHLYSWRHVLLLLRSKARVSRVRVEDQDGGSVDDVTVHHEPDSGKAEQFYHYFFQVKYHDNAASHYSTEKLFEHKENGRSLLQKFFDSWKKLVAEHTGREIRLHLVSNWSWAETDKICSCLNLQEGILSEAFFTASPKSDIGKVREEWRAHVGATAEGFDAFIRCMYFHLGEGSFRQLEEFVAQRMEHLGLRHDRNALNAAVGIVREWIRTKQGDITIDVLERALKERELYLPACPEQCVTVYLNTIAERLFDLEPDFVLDWRKHFVGRDDAKGHQLKNPAHWNKKLLPELRSVAADVRRTTTCRLIRARGLARLSAWFAFGFTFSEVAGNIIEVEQQDEHWRTDTPPSEDFRMLVTSRDASPEGESIAGRGTTIACGISVSGTLDDDVRRHLTTEYKSEVVASLLLIRPERELGRSCLRGAADAVALARQSKEVIRAFTKRWNASRLLLYYFGPLSGACFIGHQLNAVCREIQIMEDQQPGYAPSFLLES